jgi:5'-nucleotidase
MSRILKTEEQCDLIICLSHLGYDYETSTSKISDLKLAKATQDIDLIIGGHTHTFLDKPTIETNAVGKKVLVNQVGCYGLYLGKIDFYFEANQLKESDGTKLAV